MNLADEGLNRDVTLRSHHTAKWAAAEPGQGSRVELQSRLPCSLSDLGTTGPIHFCGLDVFRPRDRRSLYSKRLSRINWKNVHQRSLKPLLPAQNYLTRRLFGSMVRRISALPLPAGSQRPSGTKIYPSTMTQGMMRCP